MMNFAKKQSETASAGSDSDTKDSPAPSSLLMQMMGDQKKRKKDQKKNLSMMGGLHVAGVEEAMAGASSGWDAAVNSVAKRDLVLANTEWEDSWAKELNPDDGRRNIDIDMQRGKSLAALVNPVGMDLVRKQQADANRAFTLAKDNTGIKF